MPGAVEDLTEPQPGDSLSFVLPEGDTRVYDQITLDNGLTGLVISDPTTDKSSAALDVHVGHLCDPPEFPGLAHFLEHLLFMGTEKYPVENEYSQYLSEHGGMSNAYTGTDHTNYYFEVFPGYFEGALDRFAQFFTTPLFLSSCVEREIMAVDSEHRKNLQSDTWRLYQLEKDLSDPAHPYSKFGTGDVSTLGGEERMKTIRDTLMQFHREFYSAHIMKLVLVGKESVEVLKKYVKDMFSDIKVQKGASIPVTVGHPLAGNFISQLVKVKPVMDIHRLVLTFPFPDMSSNFRSKPTEYLSHLIGHEGPGSILALLKEKDWATDLSAGNSHGACYFDFFKVSIDLTPKGVDFFKEVALIVFQYIAMLKAAGPVAWIVEECRDIAAIKFRFKERSQVSSYASHLSHNLHEYPIHQVVSGDYLASCVDSDAIVSCLAHLSPANVNLMLVSSSFQELAADGLKSKWGYETPYSLSALSREMIGEWEACIPNAVLSLPSPNEFIPTNFAVEAATSADPKVVYESKTSLTWHVPDLEFNVPKAHIYAHIKSPAAYDSARSCVLSQLTTELLKENLVNIAYQAQLAGLHYDVESSVYGILVSVNGYNDKIGLLLEKIVKELCTCTVSPDVFERVKAKTLRQLNNWSKAASYTHAMFFINHATFDVLWTNIEKRDQLETVELTEWQLFLPSLLARGFVEASVHGNIKRDQALGVSQMLEDTLKLQPLDSYHRGARKRVHELTSGECLVLDRLVMNGDNVNSAIEVYYQVGPSHDLALRATLLLFCQMVQEKLFDKLRTKEQLGYLVFSGEKVQPGQCGFRVIIQSEKGPGFLHERIEDFLHSYLESMGEVRGKGFEKHREALIALLLETDKNLGQAVRRARGVIDDGSFHFTKAQDEAEAVRQVTFEQVEVLCRDCLAPGGTRRRKLISCQTSAKVAQQLDVAGQSDQGLKWLDVKRVVVKTDEELCAYKRSLPLCAVPPPVTPLSNFYDLVRG